MRVDIRRWTVNGLSASRVVGAGVFMVLVLNQSAHLRLAALGVLTVLLGTDVLDGLLARHWKIETSFGYILDGLGDRALYIAILLVLMEARLVLATTVFLVIFRDLLLYGMRAVCFEWPRTIRGGRVESKINAALLRVALGLKLAILYSSDLKIADAASAGWRAAAAVAIAGYVVLSYVLLFRYGGRLLKALFPQDEADQGGQQGSEPLNSIDREIRPRSHGGRSLVD